MVLDQRKGSDLPIKLNGDNVKKLIEVYKEVDARVGVEIGTGEGKLASRLCELMPGLRLYTIDPYVSYGWFRTVDRWSQNEMDRMYNKVKDLLSNYNCKMIKKRSEDAVQLFDDRSIDFVFIDGNHEYNYVLNDIKIWSKKVRSGGVVSGHDYFNDQEDPARCRVKDAVMEYTRENKIDPWYLIRSTWFWING